MTYQRTPQGQNLAQKALTKAIVYFIDGNARTFHSRDHNRSNPVPNKQLGINRLKKYISGVAPRVETAIIYDLQSDEEIMKFKNGTWL